VQLLSITLYNHDGRTRTVEFLPGQLNIVTGESRTGKGALLTIADYCLGRDSMQIPTGPITDTVAWYATTWQMENGQAFAARPAPSRGKATTQQAMLEFGSDLQAPPLHALRVNADSRVLRTEIGRRIGIEENVTDPDPRTGRQPLEASLAHAVLLCLQGQGEIASPTALFHRQGERGIADALKDTIPYFLGAVPRDQALKRAQLRAARLAQQRADAALRVAEIAAQTIDVELRALHREARAAGLVPDEDITDRLVLVRTLQGARTARRPDRQPPSNGDPARQNRYIALERRSRELDRDLQQVLADRALLLNQRDEESDYEQALQLQEGRLASIGLFDFDAANNADGSACPACGQATREAAPTAAALRSSLNQLHAQLEGLTAARPTQRGALTALDSRATALREELAAAQAALRALQAADRVTETAEADGWDFTRGRIDATLARVPATDDTELQRLRSNAEGAAATVEALEAELSDDDDREQLTSRLYMVGNDMTTYADQLRLEHSGGNVRLDLARLTVVADTERGPVPLERIGSAANWIGYHLATHLALHRYFTRQARPVPRFLLLDQPTQAHYPSEVSKQSGVPDSDTDRAAVNSLFRLLYDVAAELAPHFQIIVCDHANLPHQWFQDSVVHNWRDGRKLIPQDWLS